MIDQFESKVKAEFSEMKRLPQYGGVSIAYIATPRNQNTFENIKKSMDEIAPGGTIKAQRNIHIIYLADNTKVIMIYAKNEEEFKWLFEFHSYANSIILGKIFKGFGLKFSDEGLQYVEYNKNPNHRSVIGTLTISKDMNRILSLLDLSPERFHAGFGEIEELFDYIVESPFIRTDKFVSSEREFENFTMQEFDKYLTVRNINKLNSKHIDLELLSKHFPEIDFSAEIKILQDKNEARNNIDNKFNGRVILDNVPDIDKKVLGHAIKDFKFSFGSKEKYEEFILGNSQEEILSKFKESLV